MRGCLAILAVLLVILIVGFIAVGGGENPVSLVASPQRDIAVHVPNLFSLFEAGAGIAADSGALSESDRAELDRIRRYNNWFVRLLLPSLESAAAIDVPAEAGREPSGIAVFRYGRILRIFFGLVMRGKNPYQKSPTEPRFWRFGTTGAVQFNEVYDIKPAKETNPFEGMSDYLAAAVVYPERIEGRLRISMSGTLDALHIPWPITSIKAILTETTADGRKAFKIHGDASVRAEKLGLLAAQALDAGAMPSLAERFITSDTVLAAGWLAPEASEVSFMMTEFVPGNDYLRTNYGLALQSLRNELVSAAGPRAALVIYTQRGVRMQPGYSGILFVQELSQPDKVNSLLPSLLRSISLGVVEDGGAPPDGYPYFIHKSPSPETPKAFILHSDLMRPSEGYQPTILIHDNMLMYASSPETMRLALSAKKKDGGKVLIHVQYFRPDELGWTQLKRVYSYFAAEIQSAQTAQDTLTDNTDYIDAFGTVSNALSEFDSVDFSLSSEKRDSFSLDAALIPHINSGKE